jgi:N6-L-threonylcarbamoyladenine synthase
MDMKILAIETSCDETGVSILEVDQNKDGPGSAAVHVTANKLASQADDHQEYGGVFPTLAKRLHAQNLPALVFDAFESVKKKQARVVSDQDRKQIKRWLSRYPDLAETIIDRAGQGLPDVDHIAVTVGPGLAPALWIGVNAAKSLALLLDVPLFGVNHMAGHLASSFVKKEENLLKKAPLSPPTVSLLVSGGHTEITKTAKGRITKLGQTRDDAAGEAFDKVGRLLGLDYPAGPQVSELANQMRNPELAIQNPFSLPRAMKDSGNLDFSFSGLKTAAKRTIEQHKPLKDNQKTALAYELESAIVEVLEHKTKKTLKQTDGQTLTAGGGVTANPYLRKRLKHIAGKFGCQLNLCPHDLTSDNAVMIGLASVFPETNSACTKFMPNELADVEADSRLSL